MGFMRTGVRWPVGSTLGRPRGTHEEGSGSDAAVVRNAAAHHELDELRRGERVIARVRWLASAFAAYEVATYGAQPWPDRGRGSGLFLAAALAAGNVLVLIGARRTDTVGRARRLAVTSLTLDASVTIGYVWLFAFDRTSVQWMVLIFLPLEAATRFRLRGAVVGWVAVALAYTVREILMASALSEGSPVSSVVFRMGIIFLVTLIAGAMVEEEHRQRQRAELAAANMRRLDTLRRNLVATLAHDVRAPLTAIRGSLELLGKSAITLSADQQREIVELADRQARRLSALMFDLLDQARLEAGHLELHREQVDIGEIGAEVLTYMDSEGRFRVDVPAGTTVAADARRVEQILANLISNALRYGAPPFLLWARSNPAGGVDIAVEDHGPGIEPERLLRLFQPFESDAPDEIDGSVGLGLWIARSLAELHGGDLRNQPIDEAGARFVLHLPEATPDEVVAI